MSDITIKQIYDEIIKNRNEIKNKIAASESRLLLKVEEITNKLKEVEAENTILKEEIEELKRNNNKKNIIIFGFKQQDRLTSECLCQKLKELVNVDVTPVDLSDFYRLGTSSDSPIKIKFNSYLKKQSILKNCYKLKGTNIKIANDLTPKQREDNKILRQYLLQAKRDKNNKCYIKQNKLYINKTIYTVENLLEIERTKEDTEERPNSEPNTPTIPHFDTQNIVITEIEETQINQQEIPTSREQQTPKTGAIKKLDTKNKLRLRSSNK